MSKLDLLLQDYYRGQSLPRQKAADIKQAAQSLQPEKSLQLEKSLQPAESLQPTESLQLENRTYRQSPFNGKSFWRQGLAALLLVTVLSGVTYYHFNSHDTQYNIANEIALNHHKPFKADVLNSSFTNLSGSLSGANFSVSVPLHIRQQFDLLGARYCSISKQLAVHLQLIDKQTAQRSSLFITPSNKLFRQLPNNVVLTAHDNAHHARYWSSDDLFYALLSNDVLAM